MRIAERFRPLGPYYFGQALFLACAVLGAHQAIAAVLSFNEALVHDAKLIQVS